MIWEQAGDIKDFWELIEYRPETLRKTQGFRRLSNFMGPKL